MSGMYPAPKPNRPVPQGMSPNPGVTPMDLAGNPMLAMQMQQQQEQGMLDPRVEEAYSAMKAAGEEKINTLREHEPKEASILRSALGALPMAAMGLFTGGAAIPAALAYATAAGAMDFGRDKENRKAWEMQEADAIFETRKALAEQAETSFGYNANINKDTRATMRKEYEWIQGLPEGDRKEAAWKAWQNKYSGSQDELFRLLKDVPGFTESIAGHRGTIAGAEEGAKRDEQERYDINKELRGIEDEIGIQEVAIDYLEDLREGLANGEIGANTPFPEIEQYFSTAAARLNRMISSLQLKGLADQTLTPVSDADLQVLMRSIVNPRLSQEKKLAQFDDFIESKKREIQSAVKSAKRRYRLLGSQPQQDAPSAENEPAPFNAQDFLNGLTEDEED